MSGFKTGANSRFFTSGQQNISEIKELALIMQGITFARLLYTWIHKEYNKWGLPTLFKACNYSTSGYSNGAIFSVSPWDRLPQYFVKPQMGAHLAFPHLQNRMV
jgi:hypothetical protein